MSVYIPKGRKHYSYEFQIKGIKFRGGCRTPSKRVAKEVERRARDKAAAWAASGDPAPKPVLTAGDAFERYFQEKIAGRPSEKDTNRQLLKLAAFFGESATLQELADPDRIAEFIARRRGEFKLVGPKAAPSEDRVSDATVNREIELLRRVLRRARDVWRRDTGPLPDWTKLLLEEPDERKRELSAAEEVDLFKHLRPDYHPMVRFALMTGLRLAPIIGLSWKQVDWDAGQIRVRLKSKKPGGREHTLPITAPMRAFLQTLRGQHPIFVFTYICTKAGGGRDKLRRQKGERYPFSENGWRKPWAKALEAAGIEDFRFHDERHTAISRFVRVAGLRLGKDFAGHATIASTMRYAHVTTDDLSRAMEAMQGAGPKEQRKANDE